MRCEALVLLALSACAYDDPYVNAVAATRDTFPYFLPSVVAARAPHAIAIAREELAAQIETSLYANLPASLERDEPTLRADVVAAMNLGYLLDGIEDRPLRVTDAYDRELFGQTWRHVVLEDEFTVGLGLDYLVPAGVTSPRPALVAVHGHFNEETAILGLPIAPDLAARGYIIARPEFRFTDCGDAERDQSVALMLDGFNLLGQRVYETLLVMKFLRSLDAVEPLRVGLWAHSGGSSTTNVLVRVSSWPAVSVTDYEVDFRSMCGGQVHCETLPALLPLAKEINNQVTVPLPHLRVSYGYGVASERAAALQLFDATLQ